MGAGVARGYNVPIRFWRNPIKFLRQLTFYFFKSVLFQENFQINSSRESEYLSETQQNPPIHLLSRGGGGFVWALFGPEPGSIPNTHGFSFTRQGRSRTRYLPISLPRISATVKRWGNLPQSTVLQNFFNWLLQGEKSQLGLGLPWFAASMSKTHDWKWSPLPGWMPLVVKYKLHCQGIIFKYKTKKWRKSPISLKAVLFRNWKEAESHL